MCEFRTQVLPPPAPATWTWGYIVGTSCPAPATVLDTYIGPVLVSATGTPTTIRYTNALPTVDATNVLAYKFSTDQTLHWADPAGGEANHCHHMSMDMRDPAMPFTPNWGIPAFGSPCSLNFGEDPARPGTFLSLAAAKARPSSMAAPTRGSRASTATAPSRAATTTTRTRSSRPRRTRRSTATRTARARRRSGSTTTPSARPASTSTLASPARTT
jgi:hypothetical protein